MADETALSIEQQALRGNVLQGVIQMFRYLDSHPGLTINLGDLYSFACEGISEDAGEWVFEYIKDGPRDEELRAAVRQGDTAELAAIIDDYLSNFGL